MNIAQIEQNVAELIKSHQNDDLSNENFIYEFLLAYGHLKQSVSRLKSGERNMSSKDNHPKHDEVVWKRHLHFKVVPSDRLHSEIDEIRKAKTTQSYRIRFIIVTDFNELLAVDTKTSDTLDISFSDLSKQFDFFLPWAGMEKAVYQGENPADVKAAEKMAKLFDYIREDNFDDTNKDDPDALHNLNVFLTRLLFCFFAEDTEIFGDNQFSQAIKSHTKEDGSDLAEYLDRLFIVLNTAKSDRGDIPDYLNDFEYVNGGLFGETIPAPKFSRKSRRMLVECGNELDWSGINPDIFGSMFQAVVHPDQRSGMGMHYTSVTNIMKVIEPLFLNDLYEELEKVENNSRKLQQLQQRLGQFKIFDPACGSGNFLIIAYKELRKLEMEILKRLQELEYDKTGQVSQAFSVIELSQFYGIELDDFAHEVAILSLWLTEHQMNIEFKAEFGETIPSLPLKTNGGVLNGNAIIENWDNLIDGGNEIYVMGNPPFLGSKMQEKHHKEDVEFLLGNINGYKTFDYVCCWFYKAAQFIKEKNAKFAFVSTNSITQGEQVRFWNEILKQNLEIDFCHTSFKWKNNAKSNAGVICVIIGVRNESINNKYIYRGGVRFTVSNINPYLVDAENSIIERISNPISSIPKMLFGSIPYDGGHLILADQEKKDLINNFPESEPFIRPAIGASEMIKGIQRWCLWIDDKSVDIAKEIPPIRERLDAVRSFRLQSKTPSTQQAADRPHRFKQYTYKESNTSIILVPRVSSERRQYLPIKYFSPDTITVDAQVIYNPPTYLFSILSSRMHFVWMQATSGRLKTDYRYSSAVTYNNFPLPDLNENQISELEHSTLGIISARESHPEKSLADLYDPEYMPADLLAAHKYTDQLVDKIFNESGFESDVERLQCLFGMHQKMVGV